MTAPEVDHGVGRTPGAALPGLGRLGGGQLP